MTKPNAKGASTNRDLPEPIDSLTYSQVVCGYPDYLLYWQVKDCQTSLHLSLQVVEKLFDKVSIGILVVIFCKTRLSIVYVCVCVCVCVLYIYIYIYIYHTRVIYKMKIRTRIVLFIVNTGQI